jgi:ribosomal protein L11 methyltransferase
MFVWSKLSGVTWVDAWEERFAGDPRFVITRIPGRHTVRVEVYCEKKKEAEDIQRHFGGVVRPVKTRNWAALSAEVAPPVKVRDRILIVGEKDRKKLADIKRDNPGRQIISIPADMAFGTGHHETTSTVLRLLVDIAEEREDTPWTMLDLGTGSGVLAIAAERLGAAKAWGCDFDELAIKVALKNLKRNRTKKVTLEVADVLKWKPKEKWDCVAANLFHDVLEEAFPKMARAIKKSGTLLISGILRSQAEGCLNAGRKAGFVFEEIVTRGKWVTAQGRLA